MAALDGGARVSVLLRSLSVQGSWNYRSMLGAGVGFGLIPVLARLHREDRAALAESLGRHTGFFNAHPYLATVAIAALARMESEGARAEEIAKFKRALTGPLGTLGDRLVWARWRPLCSLFALLLFLAGAAWWVACGVFLVSYNVLHLGLRIWGLKLGWEHGREVGRTLLGSPLRRLPDRLTIPFAAISGAVLPLIALSVGDSSGIGPHSIMFIALVLAAVGFWRPGAVGRVAALGLVLGWLVFAVLGKTVW